MAVSGKYARNAARRNRNVNARIDETLFGGGQATKTKTATRRSVHSRKRESQPDAKNAVVISTSELAYMKNSSVVITAQERTRRKKQMEAAREQQHAKARARKERMLRMEEERKTMAPDLTESEQMQKEKNNVLLANAKQTMDEDHDDVKHMNQMMLYAKCSTIRDAQILEKQRMHEANAEEERRQDILMEVERIKTLKMFKERETQRAEEQKIGAQVIIQQIQEREAERIRQQEHREQEAQAMLQRIKDMELKEEEERQMKIIAGRKLLDQVVVANQAQARSKLAKKQEELEEEMRIATYLRNKEARLARDDAEKARVRAEKDADYQKMLMKQEKILDQTESLDELRAKRYQEEREREWRRTQLTIARKQQASKEEVNLVRRKQMHFKAQNMAEQAVREKEEFMRVLEWQTAQNEMDKFAVVVEREKSSEHKNAILAQIKQHEDEKAAARKTFLSEGQHIFVEASQQKSRLERIKASKLAQLEAAGVPAKYRTSLAKKEVMVSTIH